MQITLQELSKLMVTEVKLRKFSVVILFSLISISLLFIGNSWPKKYESSVSVQYDENDIIMPLMRGAAEATQIKDQARNVKSIIFGRAVMKEILGTGGWVNENISAIEQEQVIRDIIKRTNVVKEGRNIVVIKYADENPDRTYLITKKLADLFIEYSAERQKKEGEDAYDFISKQVDAYREKLTNAENNLKIFQGENADAKPGIKTQVDERIVYLRRTVDKITLEQSEAKIKLNSIQRQLSGEARLTANIIEKGEIYSRISSLQVKLDQLRLSYLDTYPDIIRIKRQINELSDSAESINNKNTEGETGITAFSNSINSDEGNNLRVSSLYDELKAQLSQIKTELLTLNNRLIHNKRLLEEGKIRAEKINNVEAKLSELTRDYEVNRDIYQDLLRRRENARVSLNLDIEERGLSFKITEPANYPILPSGLRFIHFAIMGVFLGIFIPLGIIFSIIYFDSKIRLEREVLESYENICFIEKIPSFHGSRSAWENQKMGIILILFLLLGDLSVFMGVGWMKYNGLPILETITNLGGYL